MSGSDGTDPDPNRAVNGSASVALGLLGVIGVVLAIATWRYPASDLQKVIGSLGPLLGVVSGAFVTYFFTRPAVQAGEKALAANANLTAQVVTVSDQRHAADLARVDADHRAELASTAFETARAMHETETLKKLDMNPAVVAFRRCMPPATGARS